MKATIIVLSTDNIQIQVSIGTDNYEPHLYIYLSWNKIAEQILNVVCVRQTLLRHIMAMLKEQHYSSIG